MTNMIGPLFLVFLGGGAGAVARHLVGLWALRHSGLAFPWGTLLVNGIGSFLMGLFIGTLALQGANPTLRLLVATGFLGGFTTFSTFSLDTITLWQRGDPAVATLYVGASLALALGGLVIGLWLGRLVVS